MMTFFNFEADFVDSLRCIPMQVRYKLDTCGVKLKLQHWHQLSQSEREQLVSLPCETTEQIQHYRDVLQNWVVQYTGSPAKTLTIDPAPAWTQAIAPNDVQTKAQEFGLRLTQEQWENLSQLQRFALIKLSRPSHENRNFKLALIEFQLLPS